MTTSSTTRRGVISALAAAPSAAIPALPASSEWSKVHAEFQAARIAYRSYMDDVWRPHHDAIEAQCAALPCATMTYTSMSGQSVELSTGNQRDVDRARSTIETGVPLKSMPKYEAFVSAADARAAERRKIQAGMAGVEKICDKLSDRFGTALDQMMECPVTSVAELHEKMTALLLDERDGNFDVASGYLVEDVRRLAQIGGAA